MKKILSAILGCTILGFSFAADCGVNSQGNKYCAYDNGCYEYWNQNGTHYSSCDSGVQNKNELIQIIKEDIRNRSNMNEEEYKLMKTSEQEEMEQEEIENASKQWIENKIKEQESQHVMTFGEIVFYIIVAFVFTIVVILPAKDAFFPKKKLNIYEKEALNIHEEYDQKKYTEEPREDFTYDDYLQEFKREGYIYNPEGFDAEREKRKADIRHKKIQSQFIDEYSVGEQVDYIDMAKFNGEPNTIIVTRGTIISIENGQNLEIEFADGTRKIVNKLLAPIRKV